MADDDGAFFYGAPGIMGAASGVIGGGGGGSGATRGASPAPDDESRFLGELAQAMRESLDDAAGDDALGIVASPADPADARPSYAAVATASGHGAALEAMERAVAAAAAATRARPKDTRPLCTFFQSGGCRFGDGCRFKHAAADPACVEFFESEIQRMIAASSGGGSGAPPPPPLVPPGAGAAAGASSAAAAAKQEAAVDAALQEGADAWLARGLEGQRLLVDAAVSAGLAHDAEDAETALAMAERNISCDIACAVCLDDVTSQPGRKFGLLTSCAHAFCLDCIRQWRGRIDLPSDTTRACPVCRTLSYRVLPCDRFIADEGRKALEASRYHSAQRAIPCKHYNYGKGACPFGSSCFYAHLNPDGSTAVLPKHTIRLDSEGNVAPPSRNFKLNEFLFR